jgi:gas vesicle protein
MGSFFNGVLVGIGIGLLVAPMPGEELRRLLLERYERVRGTLPEQINLPVQQVSDNVSQTASNLKESAKQAATKVRDTGSTLGNLAQQSASKAQQTGQDIADTAKQAAISVKPSTQASTTIPDEDGDAVDLTLEY